MAEIEDGSSHTLLASEIILSPDNERANDLRGRYYNSWEGNNLFSTLYPPNTSVGDRSNYCIPLPGRRASLWEQRMSCSRHGAIIQAASTRCWPMDR